MPGPLEGVNVLDFGQAGLGPWAGSTAPHQASRCLDQRWLTLFWEHCR
jgi:crotonobetainyl-CoA:carnitine CoA-transferase CaiB-like acyl-CoA transferase